MRGVQQSVWRWGHASTCVALAGDTSLEVAIAHHLLQAAHDQHRCWLQVTVSVLYRESRAREKEAGAEQERRAGAVATVVVETEEAEADEKV